MVAGCGNKTVKFLVFLFNFLIFGAGVLLMGLSLWAALDKDFSQHLPDSLKQALIDAKIGENPLDVAKFQTAFFVLAAVGGVLVVTGFLGCCGAWCENRLFLGIFFVIVLIMFIVQLGAAIAALALKGKFYKELNSVLEDIWNNKGGKGKEALGPVESAFKCCGINDGDTDAYCVTNKLPLKGCVNVIWNEVKKNMVIVGVVGIIILVIEVLAMIFSCILCSAYSKRDGYYA